MTHNKSYAPRRFSPILYKNRWYVLGPTGYLSNNGYPFNYATRSEAHSVAEHHNTALTDTIDWKAFR